MTNDYDDDKSVKSLISVRNRRFTYLLFVIIIRLFDSIRFDLIYTKCIQMSEVKEFLPYFPTDYDY
jgi:hypothetical protein